MNKKYLLFIDTTNNYCYAGLYLSPNNKLVGEIKLKVDKNVTDIVVGSIDKLFKSKKVNKKDVSSIYLNLGPGTFTGVRVGVIVTKVWKIVYPKVKIYTCNSLLLQAKKLPCISIINAKSNKLYIAIYDKNKIIIKPTLIDKDKLSKYTNSKIKNIYEDKVDNIYANFLLHINDFALLKDINKLEPIYLKDPV